ncbi:MAG: hypothetical protein P0Y55_16920 [Candidatus Cohnella colombiensis]|uniref:Spore coat protein n=1 Tax=Candidatus Cohnella colombiensis TaxID=3121368 RepID=A0AA95JAD0_9BACL|nr:MAG: hypothetical protein P0Y55_16920 [Cohnella sp.]
MYKWMSWIIRMVVTALVISFLSIWTTGYIVNSYVETVIKQLDLPIDTQPFALSGVWGTLWGVDKHPAKVKEVQSDVLTDPVVRESEKAETGKANTQTTEDPVDSGTRGEVKQPSVETTAGEEVIAPLDEPPANVQSNEIDTFPVFNESLLTDEQRQKIYSTIVSKLSQDQLMQLSNALSGGMSAEELSKLQTMLQTVLTETEYSELIEMIQGNKK